MYTSSKYSIYVYQNNNTIKRLIFKLMIDSLKDHFLTSGSFVLYLPLTVITMLNM